MFLTDARELGAREVAPDALLVKLPKKKRKIKKSNKSEENPENRLLVPSCSAILTTRYRFACAQMLVT